MRVWRCAPLLTLALVSCSWLPSQPLQELRNPAELVEWNLRAALLATGAQNGRGSLHWQQRGEAFTLTVSGPFGMGATRLQGTLDGVTVSRGAKEYFSADPGRDLAQAVGVPVPLERLRDWVRGLDPAAGRTSRTQWTSGPWEIVIGETLRVDGYELPAEMTLAAAGQQLVLKRMRWELPDAQER